TLERCLAAAAAQVERLAAEREREDDPRSARVRAAQERAARDRQARVARALARLADLTPPPPGPVDAPPPKRRRRRQPDGSLAAPPAAPPAAKEPRASTTDAEARVMKMADGGYRPAYNVQFGTDTATQLIGTVDVTTAGTDAAQLPAGL